MSVYGNIAIGLIGAPFLVKTKLLEWTAFLS